MMIRLQLLDFPKKEINLIPPIPLGIPIRLLHRGPGVRRGREEEMFLT